MLAATNNKETHKSNRPSNSNESQFNSVRCLVRFGLFSRVVEQNSDCGHATVVCRQHITANNGHSVSFSLPVQVVPLPLSLCSILSTFTFYLQATVFEILNTCTLKKETREL